MTFKTNINELKSYVSRAPVDNKVRIRIIIRLYENKQIPNFKTVLNNVVLLASKNKNTIKSGRPVKEYNKIIDKYEEAKPITGRLKKEEEKIKIKGILKKGSKIVKEIDKYKNIPEEENDYLFQLHQLKFKIERGDYNKAKTHTKIFVKSGGTNAQLCINHVHKHIVNEITEALKKKSSMKLRLRIEIEASHKVGFGDDDKDDFDNTESKYLSTKIPLTITKANYKNVIDNQLAELKAATEAFKANKSGYKFEKIVKFDIDIFETKPLRGSSFIPTPEKYSNPKCGLVNIKNDDQECFKWCMLYHQSDKQKNNQNISSLKKIEDKYDYTGIEFPADYNDLTNFEELNKVSIFVYSISEKVLKDEETKYEITVSKQGSLDYITNDIIYLLLVENEEKSHYIYIKNIDNLFNIHNCSFDKDKRFCPMCNCKINYSEYTKHLSKCVKFCKYSTAIKLPKGDNNIMKFKNYRNKMERSYIVYADFECSLCPSEDVNKIAYHKPNSACFYFVCSYDETKNRLWHTVGPNCVIDMIKELDKLSKECIENMKINKKMNELTQREQFYFRSAKHCYICNKEFTEKNYKVRDHCHRTGKYRGPAHLKCNLDYFHNKYLPVVFHNLRGYDSHLIIKKAYEITKNLIPDETIEQDDKDKDEYNNKITCIPSSYEKFISFSIGDLKFIDSFQFMSSSLEKLVENLYDKDDKYKNFKFMKKEFPEHYALLCQKGFYPYEWLNDTSKFDHQGLPPIGTFYSRLKQEGISLDNYNKAVNVYNTLNCQNFLDYHLTYLKCDVLQLADVFENFRKLCMNGYELDPANYYSAPGLSWDAMLLKTDIELELITDLEMLHMIEKMKRGGLCFVGSKRHVKANNKYLEDYDPEQESNYLMYWDANALYAWAMSEYLPYENLKFRDDITLEDILNTSDKSDEGYIIECDLSFPEEIHDKLKEYPPCPENLTPDQDWFSDFQKNVGEKVGIIKKGKYNGTSKLIPHLYEHKNYVIHYRNLKFIHNLGVKIGSIHRVISFDQKPWLKSYIDFNTKKRQKAKNDFEKDFFKLMSNAVFGKTMENVQNRIDLKLTTDNEYAIKYFSKLHFKDSKEIDGLY